MPKFFKSQPINTVMRFRAGAGYLILKTGDNPVTHCEVYCAGGMFRHVSDEKPVEMQYSDEDGEVLSVSTDTNRDLILKLEATIVMRLRSPVPVSGGTSGDQSKYCRRSQRYCGHPAQVGLLLLYPGPGASQSSPRSAPNMVPRT